MRIVVNENEILKNSVYQHKIQIEKLEEKETQSTKNIYEEIKKKNVYYKRTMVFERMASHGKRVILVVFAGINVDSSCHINTERRF